MTEDRPAVPRDRAPDDLLARVEELERQMAAVAGRVDAIDERHRGIDRRRREAAEKEFGPDI